MAAAEQWDTLAEESAAVILMDTPGDQFVGLYAGIETVTPPTGEPFSRFLFRGIDDGELYALNMAHKLKGALANVKEGAKVRITLVKEIQLDPDQNPMKDYRVEVAR